MQKFFFSHIDELVWTGFILLFLFVVQLVIRQTVKRVGKRAEYNEARIQLMGRYFRIFLLLIALAVVFAIWGVELSDMGVFLSSIFAVIGIALFAIWSILSNITSGVIMFFNFPFKVGDKIKIHDKDYPIEATVIDIKAFHLHLQTDDGEFITYPNNLMLQKAVSLVKKDAFLDQESFED